MGEKKEYRSAVRSRRLIRQAFMELLKEKSLEKITVTDIVKLADINRSTFYAHYPDVMGVIEEIQEEIVEYTKRFMEDVDFSDFFENPLPHLNNIVKLAGDNVELYRLLGSSALGEKKLEDLKNILIQQTLKTVDAPEEYKSSFEFEFATRFFMGGVVDVYAQWIRGGFDCSLDEITEQLAKMILRTKVSHDYQSEV